MTNSPAHTYVSGLGTGWYVPSIDELCILWRNRFHVNATLSSGGYTLFQRKDYWSSTEYDIDGADMYSETNGSFHSGSWSNAAKGASYTVRAVMSF